MSKTAFARLTFLIVAIPLSIFVVPTLQQAADAHGYKTPGAMVEALLTVPHSPTAAERVGQPGKKLAVLWAVNAAVILLALCLLYVLAEWRWRRSQPKREAKA